jgi:hypothetical protein
MKTGKDHVVPLSGAALAVLKRQAEIRRGDFRGRMLASVRDFTLPPRGSSRATARRAAKRGWGCALRT